MILAIHTVTPGHACHWLTRLPSSTPSTAWSTLAYVQPMYGVSTFCLEGCGQRRNIHVSQLPSLPACKGPQATSSSTLHHSSPSKQILSLMCMWTRWVLYLLLWRAMLTTIDRSNRWVEAAQLCNMEASRFTDAFIANCVAHFGMQAIVTTTGVANAPPLYGHLPARGRAFSTCSPTSTTLRARATEWWSGCTADQRCLV